MSRHEEKVREDNMCYDDTEITFCSAIFCFKKNAVAGGVKSQPADYVN